MEEVLAFLQDCKVFYMASVEDDKPKVRPFGFVMIHEGRLYFTTGNQKPFFKQIQQNPNLEVCGTNAKNEWLRLSGKAVIDARREVKQRAFEVSPGLGHLYQRVDNPLLECFYLDEAEVTFCSTISPPRIVKL